MSDPTWNYISALYPEKDARYWLALPSTKKRKQDGTGGKEVDECIYLRVRHTHTAGDCNSPNKYHLKNLSLLQAELRQLFPHIGTAVAKAAAEAKQPKSTKPQDAQHGGKSGLNPGQQGRGNGNRSQTNPWGRGGGGGHSTGQGGRGNGGVPSTGQSKSGNGMTNQKLQHSRLPARTLDEDLQHKEWVALANSDDRFAPSANRLSVITNYLHVSQWPSQIFEYNIVYEPLVKQEGEDEAKKVNHIRDKKRIFNQLHNDGYFNGVIWATDFSTLWTLQELYLTKIPEFTFSKQSGAQAQIEGVAFNHTITYDMPVSAGGGFVLPKIHRQRVIRALNAFVMRHICDPTRSGTTHGSDITQVGANKFFYKKGWTYLSSTRVPSLVLGGSAMADLLAVRGYFTSLRSTIGNKLLLNINSSTSAFFQPMLVSQFIANFAGGEKAAMEALKGVQVRITYDRQPTDRVTEPNKEENRLRFITEFGDPLSTQKFYRKAESSPAHGLAVFDDFDVSDFYNGLDFARSPQINSLDSDRRCVNVGPSLGKNPTKEKKSKAIWYPQELLEIMPDQVISRILKDPHSGTMIKQAASRPHVVAARIVNEGLDLLGIKTPAESKVFKNNLQLTIGSELLKVPAVQLTSPHIIYANDTKRDIREASWNLLLPGNAQPVHFRRPADIDKVCLLQIGNNDLTRDEVIDLYDKLQKCLRGHGIRMRQVPKSEIPYNIFHLPSENLNRTPIIFELIKPFNGTKKSACLVVLPSNNQALYSRVKKAMDCHVGLKTVCCVAGKVTGKEQKDKNFPGYLSNIALKFNFKHGGLVHDFRKKCANSRNWDNAYKDSPLKALCASDRVDAIIIGADVTHPPRGGVIGCPSIAAVVGNDDSEFMNFPGSMRLQAGRQELIEELGDMVKERLHAWAAVHNRLPKKILFYRDGVSEEQYAAVREKEIEAVKRAYRELDDRNTDPLLTFIVVGKRHHTRFFPSVEARARGKVCRNDSKGLNSNLLPGLLVDEVVTSSEHGYEFYLQSHLAIKGTARSAHYVVLENTAKLDNTAIQNLTHIMCYAYARATKGVSYCAPAYYADRLCTRGRRYLENCGIEDDATFPKDEKDPIGKPKAKEQLFEEHRAWLKKMADRMSGDVRWNPNLNFEARKHRKNPWAPGMDRIMFYL